MNRRLIDTIAVVVMMLILIGFKHFQGFENTVCLIAAMVLVELWLLNGKKEIFLIVYIPCCKIVLMFYNIVVIK